MTIHPLKTLAGAMALSVASMLAMSSSAYAQSSVTLYGSADASLLYTSRTYNGPGSNGAHQFAFSDGGLWPSTFGLRGVEDLGGNMQAMFALESGIWMGTGGYGNSNGEFFGRLAWVGLGGPFGSIKAGLQYSPFFQAAFETDPRFSDFGGGLAWYLDNVVLTGLSNPNAVTYTSPEIAGLQTTLQFALGGTPGDFQAGRQYSANLRYHLGGMTVIGALYSGNPGGAASSIPVPSNIGFEGRMLGASYTFDIATVTASYIEYKVAGSTSNRVFSTGFRYAINPALDVNSGFWYARDANDSNNHSLMASAGVVYSLSKATALYTQVAFLNNHGIEHLGLTPNGAVFGPTGSSFGANIGIRHYF